MFTIKARHIAGFKAKRLEQFADEMNAHLATFDPALYQSAQEAGIRQMIQIGIKRAGNHDLDAQGPVRLFLEMMCLLGSSFDADPQYAWASEILNDHKTNSQMRRAALLYERLCTYLKDVVGKDEVHLANALENIIAFLRAKRTHSGEAFVPAMLAELSSIYPQKAGYLGADALMALIRLSVMTAKKQGLSTDRGFTVAALLCFMLGSDCFEDPLYPWIKEAAGINAFGNADAKVLRLETKVLDWFDYTLNNIKKPK